MKTFSRLPALAAGLALALATGNALAASPQPFTAHYQVLSDGQPVGDATVKLSTAGNGEYSYSNSSKGTGGMAAMIGASSEETTRFRWQNDVPATLSYDYKLQSSFKSKQRHMSVDPASGKVTVDEGKGAGSYAAVPGMADRNSLPLAIGLALASGKRTVTVPVGVRQGVEQQQYKVTGTESVQVPAGTFKAEKVARSDDGSKRFDAWYVPQKYPVPVKITQADGGDLTLQLVSFSRP
ncbi:hypothetical protein HDE76_002146 [Rhodanobacter sp. ANJX3]|jgi:hypothetical protein|uniref:DUF3108 domain-containing protein n=1 Tax=Rhodanobacter sp. ANJX3 TaxID=2723083 RepID=UPI001612CE61|nr:DUF3108 domain-containing protein [Rhodanobacter sp. ANJX3]MBB5358930.1 hypothetical protein [Rhodanobacter sp. ANJX3]